MNANALRLAPINTVITTANMATLAKGECCFQNPISEITACTHQHRYTGYKQRERKIEIEKRKGEKNPEN